MPLRTQPAGTERTTSGQAKSMTAPVSRVSRPRKAGSRLNALVLGALGLLALVAVVQVLPSTGAVPSAYFPDAVQIGQALAAELAEPGFWGAVLATLQGWALGLAIAAASGITMGILLGSSRLLREATTSTIEFLRPIPSVALIPLAVLVFGTDIESKLLLIVYAAFWQILIQTIYGVLDVDPVADDTARAYGFSRIARIRYVVWPTALPYVMTGLRLASGVALVLAITAELAIGNPGIGSRLLVAQQGGAIATSYALVVASGVLGVVINALARAVERKSLSWHVSQRAEVV